MKKPRAKQGFALYARGSISSAFYAEQPYAWRLSSVQLSYEQQAFYERLCASLEPSSSQLLAFFLLQFYALQLYA